MDNRYEINLKDVIEYKKIVFFRFDDKIYLENTVLSREGIFVDFNLNGRASPAGSDAFVEIELSGVVSGTCSICACDARMGINARSEIVASKNSEKYNSEDSLLIKGTEVNIYQLVVETILLFLPITLTCSPNCRGLCPGCGVNLNVETCRCEKDSGENGFNLIARKFQFKNGGD
jgi:uncharacterized protein